MNPTKNLNVSKFQYLPIAFSFPCSSGESIGQCISGIYTWSLTVVGILAFFQIIYAGVMYLTAAGNASRISQAKSKIFKAILGIIILFSSYLILYTINPDLVGGEFKLPDFSGTKTEQRYNGDDGVDGNGDTGNGNGTEGGGEAPIITLGGKDITIQEMVGQTIAVIAEDPEGDKLSYAWVVENDPTGKAGFFQNQPLKEFTLGNQVAYLPQPAKALGNNVETDHNSIIFGIQQGSPGNSSQSIFNGKKIVVRADVSDGTNTVSTKWNFTVNGYFQRPELVIGGLFGTPEERLRTGGVISPNGEKSDFHGGPGGFQWFIKSISGSNPKGIFVCTGCNGSSPSFSIPDMTAPIDVVIMLGGNYGLHFVTKEVTAYVAPK